MSKKICCLILSFLMIFGLSGSFFISPKEARAAESVNKYINVVYDDSGSMIKSDGDASSAEFYDKWCQAKYAMEVFSTMLSEGDTLNIFPMSLEGKKGLTLKGSQSAAERAKAVHDWQTDAKDTPYSVVEAAYADLQKQDKNTEKWLFIITDGQFEGGISSTGIKKDFDKFTSQGVKVIYLAIGDDVTKFEKARIIQEVISTTEGYVQEINAEEIGKLSCDLGAGRKTKKDKIDLQVGIILNKKLGDFVNRGEKLATIYANDIEKAKNAENELLKIYKIGQEKIEENTIIDIIE